jgi:hypothetical protein
VKRIVVGEKRDMPIEVTRSQRLVDKWVKVGTFSHHGKKYSFWESPLSSSGINQRDSRGVHCEEFKIVSSYSAHIFLLS